MLIIKVPGFTTFLFKKDECKDGRRLLKCLILAETINSSVFVPGRGIREIEESGRRRKL